MTAIPNSILDETKKALGIGYEHQEFDVDVIMHINSVFSTLQQLGVGPRTGFSIHDASTLWTAFLPQDTLLNNVRSYMYLRVRMLFDPPATSFTQDAFQKQIDELTWRLTVQAEDHLIPVPVEELT